MSVGARIIAKIGNTDMGAIDIQPSECRFEIVVRDATPLRFARSALTDTQYIRAKVRHNRLIDLFFGAVAHPIRTGPHVVLHDVGQIETDEIYVAVRNTGQQFVIPIQAKVGSDQIGTVQIEQDLALCRDKFPTLTPRLVAVQFKKDATGEVIVMFELVLANDEIKVLDEKHYRLVPADQISSDDLQTMSRTD